MTNKYETTLEHAISNYTSRAERPGYPFGLFGKAGHSFKKYSVITELLGRIREAQTDEAARNILTDFISERIQRYSRRSHSFVNYLIDELVVAFPDETWRMVEDSSPVGWSDLYARGDQFRLYYGTVYRGTHQKPEDAFKNGIPEMNTNPAVAAYASVGLFDCGVSTSKSVTTARGYANKTFYIPNTTQRVIQTGYLYMIDLSLLISKSRTDGAAKIAPIDRVATYQARAQRMTPAESPKQEVNIRGAIAPELIVCAWKIEPDKEPTSIANTNYRGSLTPSLDEPSQRAHPCNKRDALISAFRLGY